jgi:hypothetical protein
MESCCAVHAGLELLGANHSSASASLVTETTAYATVLTLIVLRLNAHCLFENLWL